MPLPTRRLLLLALGFPLLVALGTLSTVFLALSLIWLAGLLAAVVYEYQRGPGAASFRVERQHERRLSIGEANPVTLVVHLMPEDHDSSSRPLDLRVRDESPDPIPADRRVLEGAIAPGESWEGTYHLTPVRRGGYTFGSTFLRVEMPLGLVWRQFRYRLDEPVPVYPNIRALRRYDLLANRSRQYELGLRNARIFGEGTEFERLREYLPDDDFRRINWKATARLRRPVTVAYETERSQNVLLVIDAGRLMGARSGSLDKLDHAVNSTLFLAHLGLRAGDRVGFLAFSDRVLQYVPPARGQEQFRTILDQLYRLRVEPVESDPRGAMAYLSTRGLRRSLIVLFTDLAETDQSTNLAASLQTILRRHLLLCVALNDPDVLQLAGQTAVDSQSAYEKVVARRLLDERAALLQRLERAGVLTLDVSADRLTAEAVNRYLEVKARSRL